MPTRIAIVDDDEDVRQTLREYLALCPGLACAGCYASGAEAVVGLCRSAADVVLMDVKMEPMSGIECTRRLRAAQPQVPVIMLTALGDAGTLVRSLIAGASGYLLKPIAPGEFLRAIQEVTAGGAPLAQAAARVLVDSFHSHNWSAERRHLTAREEEVMACLFEGMRDKEIADRLGLSTATIHTHMHRMFKKLGVTSRKELVARQVGIG